MDSSLVTMVLGKVIEEAKRVFADKSATMETSPLKDILLKVEQTDLGDLKNLDFSKLLGGGGLGSVVASSTCWARRSRSSPPAGRRRNKNPRVEGSRYKIPTMSNGVFYPF